MTSPRAVGGCECSIALNGPGARQAQRRLTVARYLRAKRCSALLREPAQFGQHGYGDLECDDYDERKKE